jgi:hypothetical protein
MVRVLPTIKRFFEGTVSAVAAPLSDSRGHSKGKDFMTSDLTGSARFYAR